MLGRLGNVVYWFALLLFAAGFGFFVYQVYLNPVTQEQYMSYLSWSSYKTSWQEYYDSHTKENKQIGQIVLGFGFAFAVAGKAIQYILGGTWRLRDLDKIGSNDEET